MNTGVQRHSELTQLRWRCRRGMGELDYLLNQFLERKYLDLNQESKALFKQLLNEEDDLLWAWFLQRQTPQNAKLKALIQDILHLNQSS